VYHRRRNSCHNLKSFSLYAANPNETHTRYTGITALATLLMVGGFGVRISRQRVNHPVKATRTEEYWKSILSPEQCHILREAGTETPFTSLLLDEKRPGTYVTADCAGLSSALNRNTILARAGPVFRLRSNPTRSSNKRTKVYLWNEQRFARNAETISAMSFLTGQNPQVSAIV
jgi:hypothetical protein